jgi:hypothetical protein
MAFTDPILSGTELVRSAISSADFIPGVAGWSISKNGAAEFANATVRQTLNVGGAITLQGVDLATLLNARALGTIAWNAGTPTTSTTTQAGIIYTEANLIAGRMYEIGVTNITPDISNADGTEYHLRYTQGTTAWPDNSSTLIAMSLRLSAFKLGLIKVLFLAPATDRFRFRASIVSLDGSSVRNWSGFGAGCQIYVNDVGIAPPQNGSVGPNAPGKSLKEWTITANFVKSYDPAGGSFNDFLVQGDFNAVHQSWQGWIQFSGADQALIADLNGVPVADIVAADMMVEATGWYNPGGTVIVGYHNTGSLGAGLPAGGVYSKLLVNYSGTGVGWFNLLAGGTGAGSIIDGFRTGYTKGMLLGRASEYGLQYAGVFANRPQLHLKYYK